MTWERIAADIFQSTLPARGATCRTPAARSSRGTYFNPRSPHGERPPEPPAAARAASNFNPRSPHGERLYARAEGHEKEAISIHAPRTGSDSRAASQSRQPPAISIHAPRTGSDTCGKRFQIKRRRFQSTLPARGATKKQWLKLFIGYISIHAPRTGSDLMARVNGRCHCISIHAPRTGSDG